MKELFDELAQVLRQEMGCYERLLSLLHQEKTFLIKGDLEGLTELLKKKETLGLEVKLLEEARLKLMRKAGNALGLQEGAITCSRLVQLAPPSSVPLYQALLGEFKQLIGQVAEVNEQNGMVLEGTLQYTRSLLHLFTTLAYGSPRYREDGLIEGDRPTATLFNRWV